MTLAVPQRRTIAAIGFALAMAGVATPARAQSVPSPDPMPPVEAPGPATAPPVATIGNDGEPLDTDGEVIFREETADSVRPEGEDPPVTPMPVPEAPPDPPLRPLDRVEYNNTLGLRYNPLGAVNRFYLFYRHRLYDLPGALYRDASLGIGLTPELSPAYGRIGPTIEFKPLTILTLQVGYHFMGHFGTFDLLQGFDSALDDYSDTTQDDRSAAGLANPAVGHELEVLGQFLIKVGSLVLRDTAQMFVTQQNLPDGKRLFFDQRNDMLRSNGQPTVMNDLDAVYLSDFGLITGVRFHATQHLYSSDDFRPGEPTENPNGPILRIGPLFAYRFDDLERGFRSPTVLLLAGWHLRHRWRTGVDVSQAVPQIALAFVFSGDIWNSDVGWAPGTYDEPADPDESALAIIPPSRF